MKQSFLYLGIISILITMHQESFAEKKRKRNPATPDQSSITSKISDNTDGEIYERGAQGCNICLELIKKNPDIASYQDQIDFIKNNKCPYSSEEKAQLQKLSHTLTQEHNTFITHVNEAHVTMPCILACKNLTTCPHIQLRPGTIPNRDLFPFSS